MARCRKTCSCRPAHFPAVFANHAYCWLVAATLRQELPLRLVRVTDCWRYCVPGDWDLWSRLLAMGVRHAHLDAVTAVHFGDYFGTAVNRAAISAIAVSQSISSNVPSSRRRSGDVSRFVWFW